MSSIYDDWPQEKMEKYFPGARRTRVMQKGKKFVQLEGLEQKSFQDWLRKEFPDVRFTADLAGHAEGLAKIVHIHRAENFTVPDLMIFEPQGSYHGIFMEFKTTEFKLYTNKGAMVKNQHIRDQFETILQLRDKGYWADFVPGAKRAMDIFTQYINLGDVDDKYMTAKW